MWALLSNPGHSAGFGDDGSNYTPMAALLVDLSNREYAEQLFGVRSLSSFGITTAPSYAQKDGHDFVRIRYVPAKGLFHVAYDEWVSATRNPPHCMVSSRECESDEAGSIIDAYVVRLMLTSNPNAEQRDEREPE
jgi:hypothetical protein